MMNYKSPSNTVILLLFVGLIDRIFPVLSEQQQPPVLPPCPPPGLENIVETEDDCNCFYAYAASGGLLDYDNLFPEDSTLRLAETGVFVGPDGIREYSDFAFNGNFISYTTVDEMTTAFQYARATGPRQCEIFQVTKLGWSANPDFTTNHQLACANTAIGTKIKYELTGNPDALISVQLQDIYIPNILMSEFFRLFTSTTTTAEFVCDQIVNTCKNYSINTKSSKKSKSKTSNRKLQKQNKTSKKSKGSKGELSMETCVKMYQELPSVTNSTDGYAYADGDSQVCRTIHSFMASTNDIHCPHISFEREVDINGNYKCSDSAFVPRTEYFTSEEINFIFYVGQNVFGFPADSPDGFVSYEACPIPETPVYLP